MRIMFFYSVDEHYLSLLTIMSFAFIYLFHTCLACFFLQSIFMCPFFPQLYFLLFGQEGHGLHVCVKPGERKESKLHLSFRSKYDLISCTSLFDLFLKPSKLLVGLPISLAYSEGLVLYIQNLNF